MHTKCIQLSKSVLGYLGRTFSKSERKSIETHSGHITDNKKPKEIATEEEVKKMLFSDQEIWKVRQVTHARYQVQSR